MIELLMAGALFLAPQCEEITTPAVGTPTIEVDNPEYVEAWTEEVPAKGKPTLTVDNPDYVPASTVEHPATGGEPTVTIDNPDYVAPRTETIEHPAVTKEVIVERQYKKKKSWHKGWDYKWFPANANPRGWTATGEVRTETRIIKDARTETINHPGQGEPTIVIDNPNYVEAWTEEIPAQGSPTIEIDNPDYVEASTKEHPAVGTPKVTVENPDYVPASTEIKCPEPVITTEEVELYVGDCENGLYVEFWTVTYKDGVEVSRELTDRVLSLLGCDDGPDPEVVEPEEPATAEPKPEAPKEATEPKPVVKEVAVKPVGEELAETGASIKGLVIVAALFISAGTALVVERRRRGVPPRDVPRV